MTGHYEYYLIDKSGTMTIELGMSCELSFEIPPPETVATIREMWEAGVFELKHRQVDDE